VDIQALRPEGTAVAAKSASLIDFQQLVALEKRTSALKKRIYASRQRADSRVVSSHPESSYFG
jgi:hypothetical protein